MYNPTTIRAFNPNVTVNGLPWVPIAAVDFRTGDYIALKPGTYLFGWVKVEVVEDYKYWTLVNGKLTEVNPWEDWDEKCAERFADYEYQDSLS